MKFLLISFFSYVLSAVTFIPGTRLQAANNCVGCQLSGGDWCHAATSTAVEINGVKSAGCYTYAEQPAPIAGLSTAECSIFANTPQECTNQIIGFQTPNSCKNLKLLLGANESETEVVITLTGIQSMCYFQAGSTSYANPISILIKAGKSVNYTSWQYAYDTSATWQTTKIGIVLGSEGSIFVNSSQVANILVWNQGVNLLSGEFTKGPDPLQLRITIQQIWKEMISLMILFLLLI